jgi:hypothetical protein
MDRELVPHHSPSDHSWRIHGLEVWHDLEAQKMLLNGQKDECLEQLWRHPAWSASIRKHFIRDPGLL